MDFGLLWAALIGAGFGLDRTLRGLRAGWAASAAWSCVGFVIACAIPLPIQMEIWPFVAGFCVVAIAFYVVTTTSKGGFRDPEEPRAAIIASLAFGVGCGFDGYLLIALISLGAFFPLAWRPLVAESHPVAAPFVPNLTPAPVAPPSGGLPLPSNVIEIGRRAEESRHDDEGREQREEQGYRQQLAHAGCARVA